jgi:hypothetical protein
MTKAARAIAAVGAAFLLVGGLPAASASPRPLVLTYSIREARAYAFKVSLSKQELQLIPPCDPTTDPYKCDTSQYEHRPNCPPQIALGRTKPGPIPEPASQSIVVSGGASDHLGEEPNQSSPVRLNRLLSLGRLGHSGSFPSAGGFSSDQYVDLNGRQTPEAHTQSEAFSNLPDYEERCNPVPQNASASYQHFLSRSGDGPATYHLSECFGSECTFGAGISVEHAVSVVDLHEKDGIVTANIQSELQGLDLVPGMVSVDALSTYISVRSDGTPGGLKWSVATTLVGLNVAGQKVALPSAGNTIPVGPLTIGIVPPFVLPTDSGHALSIVAPGLSVMSDAQSVFLGGAELYGSFDRGPAAEFNPLLPGIVSLPPLPPVVLPPAIPPAPVAPPSMGSTVPTANFAIRMYDTGQVAIAAILAAGLAALLLVLARWSRRWAWGRRLSRAQPLKGIDWLYRAFVKT